MELNWLIQAWEYPPEERFKSKQERTEQFTQAVYDAPGAADISLRDTLLSHIRSTEEWTTQLLCWLLRNEPVFRNTLFKKCDIELPASCIIEAEKDFYNQGASGTYDLSISTIEGEHVGIVENKLDADFNDDKNRFNPHSRTGGCVGDSKDPQLPKYLSALLAESNCSRASKFIVILTKYDVLDNPQVVWLRKQACQSNVKVGLLAWHTVVSLLDEYCEAEQNALIAREIKDFFHWISLDFSQFHEERPAGARKDIIEHLTEKINAMKGTALMLKSSYPNAINSVSHLTVWHPQKCQRVDGDGARTIKYWPSLIILAEGYWVNGAKDSSPLYQVKAGIQYVDENGAVYSTEHMRDLLKKGLLMPTGNPELEKKMSPTVAYPSAECRTMEAFWHTLDIFLYKALVGFSEVLKEKYNIAVDIKKL